METLDSRTLGPADTYARRFSTAGQYRYSVASAGLHCVAINARFTINITDRSTATRCHIVQVRLDGRHLVADPEDLEIGIGEGVMWHAADASTPRYAIHGAGMQTTFQSAALGMQSLYTHAFGLPGVYAWIDAIGGKLWGEISVRDPDLCAEPAREEWVRALKRGALVYIDGDIATPRRVEIFTGQTVFWAIRQAGRQGITITDRCLVRPHPTG